MVTVIPRLLGVVVLLALTASPATADTRLPDTRLPDTRLPDTLVLPVPGATQVQDPALCKIAGCLPDRLLRSVVPGPVQSSEIVTVAVRGDGSVTDVTLEQRLRLSGRGDYQVRERGPARSATSLSDLDPPITKFGAVVWQGFSPGSRELAAALVLDAGLEATRLPLGLRLSFTPASGGPPQPLSPEGRVAGKGTVTVTLSNQTAQPAVLPTGTDADPAVVGALLDSLRTVSQAAAGPRLPTVGAALPTGLAVQGLGSTTGEVRVPLRVTGTVHLAGTTGTLTGPGSTPGDRGGSILGTLSGDVTLTVAVDGPGQLALHLNVVPALDARLLAPPEQAPTWARWAASGPAQPARAHALQQLVAAAAVGARAASFSPYLGADLPGTGSTSFRYQLTASPIADAVASRQTVRPLGIGLAGVALSLLLANAALLWRRC